MQIDNPIRMVRELKGAPLSVILVLGFAGQRVSAAFLERATGYTDKPVGQALEYLREVGLVDHTSAGWQLTGEGRQLPLGLELTAETQRKEEKNEEEKNEGEKELETNLDTDGQYRNNSEPVAAAAINYLSLSSINDLSCCCSEEVRKNSEPVPIPTSAKDAEFQPESGFERDLVRAILAGEGIGPPMLETLAGSGFDPVWVWAHVLKWRREGKSRGILITRLRCGDRLKFERRQVEDELAEAFPDYYEWDDES